MGVFKIGEESPQVSREDENLTGIGISQTEL
jgi:hypothetical protein